MPDETPNAGPDDGSGREPNETALQEPEGDEFPGFDALVGTFMREAALWPVLAVALGSGGAFAAALLVLAFVDRNLFAAAALLLVFGMTVDVLLRARRLPSYRNGALLLLLIWGVGIALAGLALWSGIAYVG